MTVSKRAFLAVFALVAASSALVFSLQAGASRGHHEEHGEGVQVPGSSATCSPIRRSTASPEPGRNG